MEKQNRSRKNGSTKWIASWIIIFFSFSQMFSANGETTMFSSGMDDTTTYQDPSTSTYISITPFLSTVPTTIAIYTTTAGQECNKDKEFIQYGDSLDEKVPKGDDNSIQQCPSIDVPINAENLGCFYISTNGYITNGQLLPYTPNQASVSSDAMTLMPLWTDIDTLNGGVIFYQIYDVYADNPVTSSQEVLSAIETLFSEIATSFTPKWALKVTWDAVGPFNANNESLTFQFILATDGTRTYLAYLYENCEFSWLTSRNAIMGYVYPETVYYHLNSSTPGIFDLRHQTNTNSKNGVFLFEISTDYTTNYPQKCLEWKNDTTPIDTLSADYNDTLRVPCPCTLWQAGNDTRYTLGPNDCYYLTYFAGGYSKVCCYENNPEGVNSLIRGNVQVTSAILDESGWITTDYTPYNDCCLESDYCSIYNQYRPEDNCDSYEVYLKLYGYGDPHIQTLDGTAYTFNGLGEFEYLNVYDAKDNSKVLMKIQCRTQQVGTQGNIATAFSAFAIQSQGVAVQISKRDSTNKLKIFGNQKELTSFYSDLKYTWSNGPFYVSMKNENYYIVRHSSQTSIEISIQNDILQVSINLGYARADVKTNGLLGTYNNDKTDDLKTPNGVVIPSNSTEKYIYYNFGMLWKVNDSIFHYENSETIATYQFPSFEPSFLVINKTSAEYKDALKFCDSKDQSCIYDYLVTRNEAIAANTKLVEARIAYEKILATLVSPTFTGTGKVTAYVNTELVHTVDVLSSNISKLELKTVESKYSTIVLENNKVKTTIKLSQVVPVKASFQVYDQYSMSTPVFNLTVMVCPACKNGKCDTSSVNVSANYAYTCKCDKGWRGDLCDVDGRCDPFGCPCRGTGENTTCDCPTGYEFKEKCADIDECATNQDNCSQNCLNTIGSYKCSCRAGFRLVNNTECVDVDECQESLSTCTHTCINTIGSYSCSCYDGYVLNGARCDFVQNVCNNTNCTGAEGCRINSGTEECFCLIGYKWNSTSKKCEDVDECLTVNCINGACKNTLGSYICECGIGTILESDKRTCAECPNSKWGKDCANTCTGVNCVQCNKQTGCICSKGYTGTDCATDINECTTNANYCNTSISECFNTIGSAVCKCKIGFLLNNNRECMDINECEVNNDCDKNAVCTNTFGGHTCKCNRGYTGDGKTCTDIDECNGTHTCSHNCVNQIGSYSCTCNGNAKLQDDRKTCKEDEGLTYEERLYIIIFSSIGGAIIIGLLVTLWIYCFGCCECCICCACCRRRRRRHYLSALERDRLRIREAFGSVSSSLRGQLVKDEPFTRSTRGADKYLEDWDFFSPYSENHRHEIERENGWEDVGESTSSWGNIIHHFDNSREFRIERPKLKH